MNLKEKLDLLWKYLLLALLVSVVIMIVTRPGTCWVTDTHDFYGKPHSMNVKVEKKVVNGDTTTVVWVGGEKIEDVDEFLEGNVHIFKSKDGKVLKMKLDHSKKLKKIKIETLKEDD
ncbi:MAG: hypothetical protein GH143_02490 [Calditrichaeota bacterium]|nr:hypothetical protein [Calditrichota bacterium]